jgi:hypothetical protein
MKKLIIAIQLALLSTMILGQNGTYKCNSQRFRDQNDPSKNADHNNAMIITIDIHDFSGSFVLVTWPDQDISYRWDILGKLETRTNNETNFVYTFYDARFNVANAQATSQTLVVLAKGISSNIFDIIIENPEAGTTLLYHNLTKIQL